MKTFSIVIPAYNEEKNIGRCLESITELQYSKDKYEVIVVDNCSTDKTASIARQYHVKIVTEKKKGYVHALTAGFNNATAPLIAVTDADSILNPKWLSRLEEVYEKHPEVGYVTGTMLFAPSSVRVSFINMMMNAGGKLFRIGCGFHMSFRKAAWDKIAPFPPKLNFNSDGWIALEIAKKGYKRHFIQDNWVKTSARHVHGVVGFTYLTKSMLNILGLLLFNKTFYYEFGDVRE